MAKLLADKFRNEWHNNMLELLQRDVPDDDSAAKDFAILNVSKDDASLVYETIFV